MGCAIIVHGGAWKIPDALHADHVTGCRQAAEAGWSVLAERGTALDAVEVAVRIMEDNPVFNAGRGAHLNRERRAELDAGIMDGKTLGLGAVAGVQRIANPITLARRIMLESDQAFLAGTGAEAFAAEIGLPLCDPSDLVVPRERELWERRRASGAAIGPEFRPVPADTVGAVVLDAFGDLAAGNSTGGTAYKRPGRIGDTPLVGCGLYADNFMGAAVCTGWGEQIMKTVLAKTAVDQIALLRSSPTAANVAVAYFQHRIGGLGGVICVSPAGEVGWAFSTPNLAYAYRTEAMGSVVAAMGVKGEQRAPGSD